MDDEAKLVLKEVLDEGEKAMDYADVSGSCSLLHWKGHAKIEATAENSSGGGEFANALVSAAANVASIFAGPVGPAIGLAKDLFGVADAVTKREDYRAADAVIDPSWSILDPGEVGTVGEKPKERRSDDGAGGNPDIGGTVPGFEKKGPGFDDGSAEIAIRRVPVVTGQTLLLSVDLGARVQEQASGYWDWFGRSDAPTCSARAYLGADADGNSVENAIRIWNRSDTK